MGAFVGPVEKCKCSRKQDDRIRLCSPQKMFLDDGAIYASRKQVEIPHTSQFLTFNCQIRKGANHEVKGFKD